MDALRGGMANPCQTHTLEFSRHRRPSARTEGQTSTRRDETVSAVAPAIRREILPSASSRRTLTTLGDGGCIGQPCSIVATSSSIASGCNSILHGVVGTQGPACRTYYHAAGARCREARLTVLTAGRMLRA